MKEIIGETTIAHLFASTRQAAVASKEMQKYPSETKLRSRGRKRPVDKSERSFKGATSCLSGLPTRSWPWGPVPSVQTSRASRKADSHCASRPFFLIPYVVGSLFLWILGFSIFPLSAVKVNIWLLTLLFRYSGLFFFSRIISRH